MPSYCPPTRRYPHLCLRCHAKPGTRAGSERVSPTCELDRMQAGRSSISGVLLRERGSLMCYTATFGKHAVPNGQGRDTQTLDAANSASSSLSESCRGKRGFRCQRDPLRNGLGDGATEQLHVPSCSGGRERVRHHRRLLLLQDHAKLDANWSESILFTRLSASKD